MSLANLFVQGGRSVLQADAGAYLDDGRIAWLRPKIHQLVGIPCAFTIRGSFDPDVFELAMRGEVFGDIEGFLDRLPALVERFARMMSEAVDEPALSCWYVSCFARGRPWGFLIASDDRWFAGAGVRAFELKPVLNSIGGLVSASEMLGRPIDFADAASFDIERDSLDLIFAQRARPWADFPAGSRPGAVEAIRIAGWIDQAEVTAEGVNMTRLWEWPGDAEGEVPVAATGRRPACPGAFRLVHPTPLCAAAS